MRHPLVVIALKVFFVDAYVPLMSVSCTVSRIDLKELKKPLKKAAASPAPTGFPTPIGSHTWASLAKREETSVTLRVFCDTCQSSATSPTSCRPHLLRSDR